MFFGRFLSIGITILDGTIGQGLTLIDKKVWSDGIMNVPDRFPVLSLVCFDEPGTATKCVWCGRKLLVPCDMRVWEGCAQKKFYLGLTGCYRNRYDWVMFWSWYFWWKGKDFYHMRSRKIGINKFFYDRHTLQYTKIATIEKAMKIVIIDYDESERVNPDTVRFLSSLAIPNRLFERPDEHNVNLHCSAFMSSLHSKRGLLGYIFGLNIYGIIR